jgi:hypothetical protein
MSSTQEPTQSGSASTTNFLGGSGESRTEEPAASDLPSDFFAQMSGPKMSTPAPEEAPAKTFFAHTIDAGASVIGTPVAQSESGSADAKPATVVETETIGVSAYAQASDADVAAFAELLSADRLQTASDANNPAVDDIYRDMVRQSLSSDRVQGGISRVRTYTVALVALVLGGGGLYAYSNDLVSFDPPEEETPVVLESAPIVPPATSASGTEAQSGQTASGTKTDMGMTDAPALDLVPRDSGVIVNKKKNHPRKRSASGSVSESSSGAVRTAGSGSSAE